MSADVAFPRDAAVAGERALVWVEGPDAASFLHGLLSNDIASLTPGGSRPALLLDAKGRLVAAATVLRDGAETFTLVTEPHLGAPLADALARYHFSEDLDVLGPEPSGVLLVAGDTAPDGAGDPVVPGAVPGTWEVLTDDPAATAARLGRTAAGPEVAERARVAAGVPRLGIDTGPTTLVQEAGLETTAVSFEKGCYLGQETVARAQFRGRVNRVLRLLEFAGPAPAVPAPVVLEDAAVGTLTSAVALPAGGALGLAILRREAAPGAAVTVGDGVTATVREAGPATEA